jgi:hypothetical protein
MTAYIAMNGNDATAKLYETKLTRDELRAGVLPFRAFDAAAKALAPFGKTHACGMIDLGYVVPVPAPAPAAVPVAEAAPEAEENLG